MSGRVFGWGNLFLGLSAATGNVTAGVLKEVVGGFDALWACSAVLAIVSACLFMQLAVDEDRQ